MQAGAAIFTGVDRFVQSRPIGVDGPAHLIGVLDDALQQAFELGRRPIDLDELAIVDNRLLQVRPERLEAGGQRQAALRQRSGLVVMRLSSSSALTPKRTAPGNMCSTPARR